MTTQVRIFRLGLLLSLVPLVASADQYGDFGYMSDGSAITITSYTGSGGNIEIPPAIDGLPVTAIGDNAFNGYTSITGMTIPDCLTTIGRFAVSSCSLTNVTIPSGVISIRPGAFTFCKSLLAINVDAANTFYRSEDGVLFDNASNSLVQYPGGRVGSYVIPDGVTEVRVFAFAGSTQLTSVVVPDSVLWIQGAAFDSCWALANVTLGNSVQGISSFAFTGCSSLSGIHIPSTVIYLDGIAFLQCPNLAAITVDKANSSFSSRNGVLFDKAQTRLISYPGGKLGDYSIPTTVTTVEYLAFSYSSGLTGVTIPDSIGSIPNSLFYGSTNLASVFIPNTVTNIGTYAFADCSSLTTVEIPLGVTKIGDGTFGGCTSLTNIVIPASVTSIGVSAFKDCSQLSTITIPDTLTEIEGGGFMGCTTLTNIVIPASVTSIGRGAFNGCSSLDTIIIPDNVTSIGEQAFRSCDTLREVHIGSGLTSIASRVFERCPNLVSVTIGNGVTNIADWAFLGCSGLSSVYFMGNPPLLPLQNDSMFGGANQVTVYYLPNRDGWGTNLGGRPTSLWLPKIQPVKNLAGAPDSFAFNVSWASGMEVVVEVATSLSDMDWTPIQTNTIGSAEFFHFDDPTWSTHDSRFYRAVMR